MIKPKAPMPIKNYSDGRYLIDCDRLAAQLDAVLLIDLRPAEDFALGHIKGAKHLDLYAVSLNDTSPAPLDSLLHMFNGPFGARGVSRDQPVVIYDHESGERAARVFGCSASSITLMPGCLMVAQTHGSNRVVH